jgi:riboflavin kinase/FMN adenylyltransferase
LKIIRLNYNNYLADLSTENPNILNFNDGCCLTIGNFDGIHLGHQKIINQLKKTAKQLKLPSVIITFNPHPYCFFNNINKNYQITSLSKKISLIKDLGIDYLIIINFNHFFSKISANDFIVNFLEKIFNVKHLIIGYDFTFGKDRHGNFRNLENRQFSIEQTPPIKININNKPITCSSTLARKFIANGKIKSLNNIINRNYSISGIVVNGQKLAKKIGFATANLKPNIKLIYPKFGVYNTLVSIENSKDKLQAITNFGIKPSFDNKNIQPIFETHILNFDQDLYGKKITVEFIDYIREEKKFHNIESLKKQIIDDINFIKYQK